MIRNRYEVVRKLGAGAGGTVYEVADSLRAGARVALKALWAESDNHGWASALRDEFRVLAVLRHPLLCRVYDFGRLPSTDELQGSEAHSGFFLTRELIDGVDLMTAAEAADRSLGVVCRLLADAARGLDALHDAGMRHGDFKPANAIVDSDGAVRLIDFGLSVEERVRRSAGTIAFMAPELIAHADVDRRADLYALGVALYQMCTGRLPSGDRRGDELIAWHHQGHRPSLAAAVPEVPDSLDRICRRLMMPDAAERFPTAAEVASALDACVAELGEPIEKGAAEHLVPPVPAPQVAELERELGRRTSRLGGPAMVELAGDPGSGRSTILRELTWRAQLDGVEVIHASHAGRGQVLGVAGTALAQIAALAGRELPTQALADTPASRLGAFAAIARWLADASEQWPIAIVIDDSDYADATTRDLVRYLAFGLPAPARVLWVCATTRSADETAGVPRIAIDPMGSERIAEILRSIVGRVDDHLVARIAAHTGGNLLHVLHVARHIGRDGFASIHELDELEVPAALAGSATTLLDECSDAERELLRVLAAFGRPATDDEVRAIVSAPPDTARLERCGAISFDPAGRMEIARPALRHEVYGRIDDGQRARLHLAIARALEPGGDDADPQVFAHYVRAGDAAQLRSRWRCSLARLRGAGDHFTALHLADAARAALGDVDDDADVRALRLEIGELARLVADTERARSALQPIVDSATASNDVRDRARFTLARAFEDGGEPDRAQALFETIIARVDAQLGPRAAHELARLHIKRGRTRDALTVVEDAIARRDTDDVHGYLLAARAFANGVLGAEDGAAGQLDTIVADASDRGDDALVHTAANYGALLSFRRGDYNRARALYEQSLRAAEATGDVTRIGTLHMNLASLAFHVGDYGGCIERHTAAIALLRAAAATTSLAMARKNLGHALLEVGAYEQAHRELVGAREAAAALELRTHVAGIDALIGLVEVRRERFERGIELLRAALRQFEDHGDDRREAETLLDLAECLLERHESDALAGALTALERVSRSKVAMADLARRSRLSALCAVANARAGTTEAARTHLDDLRACVEQVLDQHSEHTAWRLHYLAALACAALGDDDEQTHRRRALEVLDRMADGLPASHRAGFWHDPRRRWLRGTTSAQRLRDRGHLPPDQAHVVLDNYRRLADGAAPHALIGDVLEFLLQATGAERGHILVVRPNGELHLVSRRSVGDALGAPGDLSAMQRNLAERVLSSGAPVLDHDYDTAEIGEAETASLDSYQRAACIPIRAAGRVGALLYLESRSPSFAMLSSNLASLAAFSTQLSILIDAYERQRAELDPLGLESTRDALRRRDK